MNSRRVLKDHAKKLISENLGKIFLIEFVTAAILIGMFVVSGGLFCVDVALGVIFVLVTLICSILLGLGLSFLFYDLVKNNKFPEKLWKKLFICFTPRYCWSVIKLFIAYCFFSSLWGIVFIIPTYIKIFEYSQAFWILKDHLDNGEKVTARECLKESSRMMQGHKEDLFILSFSFIGWQLLALLILLVLMIIIGPLSIIGIMVYYILWLTPYCSLSILGFYLNVKSAYGEKTTLIFNPNGSCSPIIEKSNKNLTRANWVAFGCELLLIAVFLPLSYFYPSINQSIENETFVMKIKSSKSDEVKNCDIKFNKIKDGKGKAKVILDDYSANESKSNESQYDKLINELQKPKIKCNVTFDSIYLGSEKSHDVIALYDLKISDKGQKIVGNVQMNENKVGTVVLEKE